MLKNASWIKKPNNPFTFKTDKLAAKNKDVVSKLFPQLYNAEYFSFADFSIFLPQGGLVKMRS